LLEANGFIAIVNHESNSGAEYIHNPANVIEKQNWEELIVE